MRNVEISNKIIEIVLNQTNKELVSYLLDKKLIPKSLTKNLYDFFIEFYLF